MGRVETSSYGSYTRLAIALHWAIAFAILGLLAAGWWMTWALEAKDEATRRLAYEVIQLHKALGLTVLALSLARLFWRLLHPAPRLPDDTPAWRKRLSGISHFLLYGFMIGAPLTGWAMVSSSPEFSSLPTSVFGLFIAPHLPVAEVSSAVFGLGAQATSDLARDGHHLLAILGALLLLVHVAAALKHHFVDQDHILARITPGVEPRRPVFEPPAPAADGLSRGLAGGLFILIAAAGAALFLFAGDGPEASAPARSAASDVAHPDAALASAAAPLWRVEREQSAIAFSGAHLGAPFRGAFERWSADIRFDPDNLSASRVRVEIETGSAKTGDAQYDGALPQADWFDVASFPIAVFEASRFEWDAATERYRAIGALAIKGRSLPAILPFELAIDGDRAVMKGEIALDRLAYGLGAAADPTAAFVAKEIVVSVETTARRTAEEASKP